MLFSFLGHEHETNKSADFFCVCGLIAMTMTMATLRVEVEQVFALARKPEPLIWFPQKARAFNLAHTKLCINSIELKITTKAQV